MKKHKVLFALMPIAIILTIFARHYAVARRLSMGMSPSWGGEFLIIPFFLFLYFSITADWSTD